MPDDQVMTAAEVAAYLKLDHTTVQRMAARGELPAVKMGRHWRFKKEAIDAVFDEDAKKKLCAQ